ncbi:pre-mRNA-splicing factor ATP-dependent RNA helicase DEAH1-like [Camellia sinensis]|uniref:pre-mRNA-splicing factor ATP-dependent RNA helicase DEAH1-like n=1 Tax=Camellia sinensis TaxID=4442 RepID=UPI001036CCD4|nr:pre-mRNA-splicing factor ATP-dependent RNA helicase DEAH1-like [Camellia sinensis]XP_028105904.1 pre-mRNA-splicing factor ATP-dependent RNA helicase DEAH1-like [Camellia sinensis]XP_028105905.1 pre-mRNA-splicing factor ATP-dependent RNA helicase DEAH1-like [Camellia sinensis]
MGLTRKADRYGTLTGSRKGEKVSRQEYLKKMEQKKLKELRDDIEDEQYLFDGVKLTEAEYGELRYVLESVKTICASLGNKRHLMTSF